MDLLRVDTLEEAREKLKHAVGPDWFRVKEVPLEEGLNTILAEDVYSSMDIPQFCRSMVDGYAVRAVDTMGAGESLPVFLKVVEEVAIGTRACETIMPGTCAYVPTGGMLPEGADSCVMVEYCEAFDRETIAVYSAVSPGRHMVEIGEDCKNGSLLFPKGTRIRPQEIGALAAQGITVIKVFAPLRLSILSTGDELVAPGNKLNPGQIYDINTSALKALAEKHGFQVCSYQTAADKYEVLKAAIEKAKAESDVVVISGGSSKGKKDMTAQVIDELTDPGVFTHGLALKPGKPTILGADAAGKTLMIGLPGHPVAAMAVFEMLPVWLYRYRTGEPEKLPIPACVDTNVPGAPGRKMLLFVELVQGTEGYTAKPIFGKSGLMSTITRADGYAVVELNQEGLKAGERIWVQMF